MRTIDNFDAGEFIREVYLRAVPSVDLNEVSEENPVDCNGCAILESEWLRLLNDFDLNDRKDGRDGRRADVRGGVFFWMVNSGPKIMFG